MPVRTTSSPSTVAVAATPAASQRRPGSAKAHARDGVAGEQRREQLGLLLVAARPRQGGGDHVDGEERARRRQPAHLLGDDDGVARRVSRQAAATVRLGHEHGRPAELGRLPPPRRGRSPSGDVVQRADVGERRLALEELPRRVAEELLVLGQLEVHGSPFPRCASFQVGPGTRPGRGRTARERRSRPGRPSALGTLPTVPGGHAIETDPRRSRASIGQGELGCEQRWRGVGPGARGWEPSCWPRRPWPLRAATTTTDSSGATTPASSAPATTAGSATTTGGSTTSGGGTATTRAAATTTVATTVAPSASGDADPNAYVRLARPVNLDAEWLDPTKARTRANADRPACAPSTAAWTWSGPGGKPSARAGPLRRGHRPDDGHHQAAPRGHVLRRHAVRRRRRQGRNSSAACRPTTSPAGYRAEFFAITGIAVDSPTDLTLTLNRPVAAQWRRTCRASR